MQFSEKQVIQKGTIIITCVKYFVNSNLALQVFYFHVRNAAYDSIIVLPGDMYMKIMTGIFVTFLAFMILFTGSVNASEATYKIRSTVYDSTDSLTPAGDFYWDANSFSGFWFQIKPGLSSEVLYVLNEVNSSSVLQLGDEIKEGNLYYISKPQIKKTKIGGINDENTFIVDGVDLKKYYLMGFFGSQYVAMPEDTDNLSAGCKPDKIARILMESDDESKKQMYPGDEWQLADGWSLVVQQVDVDGNKVWVQLNKDGVEMDTAIITCDSNLTDTRRTYLYRDSDDNPVFYCYVDSIFRGTDTDFVVFTYPYLISNITTLETGDTYGVFDVDGFAVPSGINNINYAGSGANTVLNAGDNALIMSSNDDITLDPDQTIDLYGGMYLKTEDTASPCLKMTLWQTCTITVPDTAVQENDTADAGIISVDMEDSKNTGISPSTKNEAEASGTDTQEPGMVESSFKMPGFEFILGILGLLGASGVKKLYK